MSDDVPRASARIALELDVRFEAIGRDPMRYHLAHYTPMHFLSERLLRMDQDTQEYAVLYNMLHALLCLRDGGYVCPDAFLRVRALPQGAIFGAALLRRLQASTWTCSLSACATTCSTSLACRCACPLSRPTRGGGRRGAQGAQRAQGGGGRVRCERVHGGGRS